MNVRLAIPTDARQLALLHRECGGPVGDSLVEKLGTSFLRAYYAVMLLEASTVIICATDAKGVIVGFCSGSVNAARHRRNMRRHRWRLALGSVPAVLRRPSILFSAKKRAAAAGAEYAEGECHSFFWAWREKSPPVGGAILLFKKWLAIVRTLGAKDVHIDVRKDNAKVVAIHRALGAAPLPSAEGESALEWRMVYRG